ncbi:MAG: Fic family protein [Ignavibacteriae bacterium]|nr:Fic family protein [Ignavibacteriota bacterium]
MKPNSEITYLEELIQEFGPRKKIDASEAFELLRVRYEKLEQSIPVFVNALMGEISRLKINPQSKNKSNSDFFTVYFAVYCNSFHELLFKDILKNAGSYRKSSDPKDGYVGFGGESRRRVGSHKFSGSNPKVIKKDLASTFVLLDKNSKQPVKDALEFYRRFVYIHPFYDANGRIGRLILSIYLLYFDLYINWREIESGGNKTNFIKKLNECHKRQGKHKYDEHFNYLYSFFEKFVVSTDTLKDK